MEDSQVRVFFFFFQAEDGIRDVERSRGLGDVYKRQVYGRIQYVDSFPDYKVEVVTAFPDLNVEIVTAFADSPGKWEIVDSFPDFKIEIVSSFPDFKIQYVTCLLYTSDAADDTPCVDLGGRRIIKKKKNKTQSNTRAGNKIDIEQVCVQ
eukprot:TRINITY_DN5807_c0_g1_i4.p1 TRINITY_DN5807_c0_g1~~TRINITY_DN5807_c0_g1_i4.p1  ORF type:complete len:150 (-),score=36.18 TRINITY_DN5807_c0_g1_i4:1-450(-)